MVTVSTVVEIPEPLHDSIQQFLHDRPAWDEARVYQAMASLFLMQNGVNDPQVNSLYLDSLFKEKTNA